jgi:hypothetical protein
MLLLAVIGGCATTRPDGPPPPDPLQEQMARVDRDLADAHAREQEPAYVACRTSVTPECMTMVDTHRTYVSQLESRQLQILGMMQERGFSERADRRDRVRTAAAIDASAATERAARKDKDLDCRQDPSYPGMPGKIHCTER